MARQAHQTGVSHAALRRQIFANAEGMNACVACCDRWADGERVGLEWFRCDGVQTGRGFKALRGDASRFANLLTARGVRPGEVVAGLLPRGAEMLAVILGTWRAGAVYQPLSTGLGPAALNFQVNHAGATAAKLIVTDAADRARLDHVEFCPPVLVVARGNQVREGDGDFRHEMARQSSYFAPVPRAGDDPFLLLVGGRDPRPLLPKLRSLLALVTSIQIGLDPNAAEIGWEVNDPAWSAGLYFSVLRPLLLGQAATAYECDEVRFSFAPTPARATDVESTTGANHRTAGVSRAA